MGSKNVFVMEMCIRDRVSYAEVHGLEELDKVILYMHSLTFRREVIQKMGAIIDENCFYVDMEYCIFPLL